MKGIALLGHILAASLLLTACRYPVLIEFPVNRTPDGPEKVEVLYEPSNKPFEVIAFVSIDIR